MSENINDLCGTINGRPIAGYHRVMYGETQEYLESLAEAGYILMYSEDNPKEEGKLTVAKPNVMPEYLKDYATNVVYDEYGNFISCSVEGLFTLAEDNTGMNNYADGPTKQITSIDSTEIDLSNASVTINTTDSDTADTVVATEQEGTTIIQNNLYPGVKIHMVQYGETQEYLESLQDEGYLLGYNKDNPPEEGKLTISKPNPEPGTITVTAVADPTDTTLSTTNHLYSPDFIAWLRSYYRDEIAPKMNGIDSLTVEEAASFHEELNSFKEYLTQARIEIAYFLQDMSSYEDLAVMQDTIESYIASLNGNETDTTVNDTTDRTITLPGGLIVKLSDVLLVTDSLSDDTNTYFYRVSDYINPETGRLEDIPIPLYVCKNSEQVAFISTMDAETEAVKSVQVACAESDGWRTIGVLNNPDGIDWKYQAGNLTGSGAPSVVWHAQELGALGVWTDGTDNWTGIAGWFDENWTMLGCGDFDGDGKDSVLMSLNGGLFYSVDLDGTLTSLGSLNWSSWEFGAIGDFAGDGKDDVVLFHRESGTVVLLADGNADDYTSIGQLDASDWGIAGALDVDADGKDDLLVKQSSSGLVGAYASADMNQWSVVDAATDYSLA